MITTDKQLDACPYCGQDQSFDIHSKRYDSEAHRCVHTMKCRGCGKRWKERGPIGITLEGMTEEDTAMWEKANELAALERELQQLERRQAICIQSITEARKAMGPCRNTAGHHSHWRRILLKGGTMT